MCFSINGGRRLEGRLRIMAAKNSILPIIAACVLTKSTVVLKNCPKLLDVLAMLEIIKSMGGTACFEGDNIVINCKNITPAKIDNELTGCLRASIFILGPILSRFRLASVSYPGGCAIGERPIDLHLDGLRALGVKISETKGGTDACCNAFQNDSNKSKGDIGTIVCEGSGMQGGEVNLRFPSVGATENIMMAAVLARGATVINGAAREPEIKDLACFINSIGGRVYGAGTSSIVIHGVDSLRGGEFEPIPDRIVAGTYLAACAAAGGKIVLENVVEEHILSTADRLSAAGCSLTFKNNAVFIRSVKKLKSVTKTATMPYPGFPTDMQAQLVAMLSVAEGQSIVEENLFESRFRYATQLCKMGADIDICGTKAVINGVKVLHGQRLEAQDLRGGAALIIAGLCAKGESVVSEAHHIDRGYYKIENDLSQLGASIIRVEP